jgi:hypothetical protein
LRSTRYCLSQRIYEGLLTEIYQRHDKGCQDVWRSFVLPCDLSKGKYITRVPVDLFIQQQQQQQRMVVYLHDMLGMVLLLNSTISCL